MYFSPKKRKKIDYGLKKYKVNPLFRKKGNVQFGSGQSFNAAKYILAGVLVITGGLAWFLLFSNYFRIVNININGQGSIDRQTVRDSVSQELNGTIINLIPKNNFFLLKQDVLYDKLNSIYNFGQLSVKKSLPGTLDINYEQRDYKYIWTEQGENYYIDNFGYLIEKTGLDATNTALYRHLENNGSPRIKGNKIDMDEAVYASVDTAARLLADKHQNIPPVEKILIDNDINNFKLKIKDGPEVIINLQGDLDKQLSKLEVLITEKLKGDFMKKRYIDIRFGDMIYYQ